MADYDESRLTVVDHPLVQLKNAVNHTKASTKNWNNSNLLTSNTLSSHGLKRSLYLDVLPRDVRGIHLVVGRDLRSRVEPRGDQLDEVEANVFLYLSTWNVRYNL